MAQYFQPVSHPSNQNINYKPMKKVILFVVLGLGLSYAQAQKVEAYSSPVQVNFKAKDTSAPEILIEYGATTDVMAQTEHLIINVDDIGGGINTVTVNSKIYEGKGQERLRIEEDLMPGTEVVIKATDVSNNVKEKNLQVRFKAVPVVASTPATVKRHNYAVLFGAQDYQDPNINSLSEPLKDAERLKKVLINNYTFAPEEVKVIKNPTYETMVNTFDSLRRLVTDKDFLLIFYAGHGYYEKETEKGYWLPVDASKDSKSKWYRNSALKDDIESIPSKHTLLISDACFSGSIFKTRAAFNNASVEISKVMNTQSRKCLTSGALTEVPDKSVFLDYLIKELENNQNKYMRSEDLFFAIREPVRNNSPITPLFGVIQSTGDEGGDFVFIRKD